MSLVFILMQGCSHISNTKKNIVTNARYVAETIRYDQSCRKIIASYFLMFDKIKRTIKSIHQNLQVKDYPTARKFLKQLAPVTESDRQILTISNDLEINRIKDVINEFLPYIRIANEFNVIDSKKCQGKCNLNDVVNELLKQLDIGIKKASEKDIDNSIIREIPFRCVAS